MEDTNLAILTTYHTVEYSSKVAFDLREKLSFSTNNKIKIYAESHLAPTQADDAEIYRAWDRNQTGTRFFDTIKHLLTIHKITSLIIVLSENIFDSSALNQILLWCKKNCIITTAIVLSENLSLNLPFDKIQKYNDININNVVANITNKYIEHENIQKTKFTIGIDGRSITCPINSERGIGKYALNHLLHVLKLAPEISFILFLDRDLQENLKNEFNSCSNLTIKPLESISNTNLDLFHIPDPMSIIVGRVSPFKLKPTVKTTVLFHDLTPIIKRNYHFDNFDSDTATEYLERLKLLKNDSIYILANSQNTKKDLVEMQNINSEKISVIMAGVGQPILNPNIEELHLLKNSFKIVGEYFLVVGGLDAHKGFATTAAAFGELSKECLTSLVIVGSINDPYKQIYKKILNDYNVPNVIFTGFIPDEDLNILYSGALALLYPSEYEGFGFPVAEANANSCPAIICNVSSLPEVGGSAAIYINPGNVLEMKEAMTTLFNDPHYRIELGHKAKLQSTKFSWESCAEKTLNVWHSILSNSNKNNHLISRDLSDNAI
jgi:glycosyltransferase involved in cell wall biosynthesis